MKINISSAVIRQYALVFTVNLAVLSTGMSLSWPSPVLVKLQNSTETPLPEPVTDEEGSWIVSAGFLCCLISNIFGGMLLDVIGRKYCILLAMVPKLLMSFILIFANRVWMFIFCRAVMLMTDSLVFIVVPVYASEIACKDNRGALGTFLQIFSSLGIVVTLGVGPFLSYTTYNVLLTATIAVCTIPLIFLPDTPFHLYAKGRIDDAMKVLSSIRGSEEKAKQEMEEYRSSKNNEEKVAKVALFKNQMFWKSVSLGILVVGGAQLTGTNAVQFYLQTILESTQTSVKPEIASVIIGIIQILASFFTTPSTTWFNRKTILLTSLAGISFGMLGLGTFFKTIETEGYKITGFMNYLPIISLILIKFCYSAGIGSLLWVVVTEIFEGPARALGFSISLNSSSLLVFITTKYLATMISTVGPAATYWFFSCMCVLVGTLIYILLPETKGKTFGEIQEALGVKKVVVEDKTADGKKEKSNV
ncbi:facilitated trehalose transporter Tret1-like [Melitaea cinxia]|uniref:facilitated trehalose transporter Tret1-like n=1 Tax=Melitaea cinxia TaxID=113334 RepID=UPI001E270E33|nr:facilitated trehalose transporter Tret1-like [Melitaea cinxia]